MAFADLEKDPLGELERAYNALGWSDAWQSVRAAMMKVGLP